MKGIFLSVPSVSVNKTLTPVVDEIAANGHQILFYNAKDYEPSGKHQFTFRSYPDEFKGYFAGGKMDEGTSYFDFGDILINSAESLIDFLLAEFQREKPDFVMHSHLAVWGKLIAKHFNVPSITLYTTFVLDKRIMLPFFRKINEGKDSGFHHVNDAINFYRKCDALYGRLQLKGRPDVWDVYINKGDINVACILVHFQHQKELFGNDFHYLGYPTELISQSMYKKAIYISMGTVFNADVDIYKLCIDVLKEMQIPCVLSVGANAKHEIFRDLPEHINVEEFVDQKSVLSSAKLFITRGGMASIHEAIYTSTPMIVIPVIPEQQLSAEKIADLKIGIHIKHKDVNHQVLRAAILHVLDNYSLYSDNLEKIRNEIPGIPPGKSAAELVTRLLVSHYQIDLA